jgi:hypothetical protein
VFGRYSKQLGGFFGRDPRLSMRKQPVREVARLDHANGIDWWGHVHILVVTICFET